MSQADYERVAESMISAWESLYRLRAEKKTQRHRH